MGKIFGWMLAFVLWTGTHGLLLAQTEQELLIAESFFNKKEYDKAIRFYERFYQYQPKNKSFFDRYITCLVELGDAKEALKLAQKQAKRFAQDLSYPFEVYRLTKVVEGDKKSERYFETMLRDLPPSFEPIDQLAQLFSRGGEVNKAVKLYERAEEVLGFSPVLGFRKIEMAQATGQTALVAEQVVSMLRSYPLEYNAIQNVVTTLLDEKKDAPINVALKKALQEASQRHPDMTIFNDLLLWMLIQEKEFQQAFTQARALDRRLKEEGGRMMPLARICLENNAFSEAGQGFQYVVSLGPNGPFYLDARMGLVETLDRKIKSEGTRQPKLLAMLDSNYKALIEFLGPYPQANPIKIKYARLLAFDLGRPEEALQRLQEVETRGGAAPDQLARLRLEKADILILLGDYWEPSLLYGQVEKQFPHDVLGQEAKFRNARLAYFRGEFSWALTQAKVLKSATSKLIANDAMALSLLIGDHLGEDSLPKALDRYARADLLRFCGKTEEAMKVLDSLYAEFPQDDMVDEADMLYARLAMSIGEVNTAQQKLSHILSFAPYGILADDALFTLAGLYEGPLKNPTEAGAMYQKLLTEFPGSLFAAEARLAYRRLFPN
jgi:tetratricopeptide (TPR) repeat protein